MLTKNGGLGKRIYNQALLSRDLAAIARAITLFRKHTDPANSLLPIVHAHGRNLLGRLEQIFGQTKEARAHFTEAREEFEQQLKEQEEHPSLLQGSLRHWQVWVSEKQRFAKLTFSSIAFHHRAMR